MDVVAQCLKNKGCLALPLRKQKAEDIMTSAVVTVRESTPTQEIAAGFSEKGINRVPVADADNRLVGIVSRENLVLATCAR